MTHSPPQGTYRQPTIHGDRIVFVSEDDLWTVSAQGGIARRLTSVNSATQHPCFSPDGSLLAFSAREEGNTELYVMDSLGGPMRRLTHVGAACFPIGWSADGQYVLFASYAQQYTVRHAGFFKVHIDGGQPIPLHLGHGFFYDTDTARDPSPALITRYQIDNARWKRYKGGTAGQIWVDSEGTGEFSLILQDLRGNMVRAQWFQGRVLFLSDHEGFGNLYTCAPDGSDIKRHTHHTEFYARYHRTDGTHVVYQCGADLYTVDPSTDALPKRVEIQFHSARTDIQPRFVPAARNWMTDVTLNTEGDALLVNTRGKLFSMGLWEGATTQHGNLYGTRYRLPLYTHDGAHIIALSDEGGEDHIVFLPADPTQQDASPERFIKNPKLGRITRMKLSPNGDYIALTNHRHELGLLNLKNDAFQVLYKGPFGDVNGFDWSPHSDWITYNAVTAPKTAKIRLYHIETDTHTDATNGAFLDHEPRFDPKGRFIYFLSQREFNPVYDRIFFQLGFPRASRICLLTLRDDVENPFTPTPKAIVKNKSKDKDTSKSEDETANTSKPEEDAQNTSKSEEASKDDASEETPQLNIDLERIQHRVLLFPVSEGRFDHLEANDTHVFFTNHSIAGSLNKTRISSAPPSPYTLKAFELDSRETKDVARNVASFALHNKGKSLLYRSKNRVRLVTSTHEARNDKHVSDSPSRKSGWFNFNRISLKIDPLQEWAQMLAESHRIMRDHFWTEDMSGIDWDEVYTRYSPRLQRVGSRTEYSDLVWEMQGELGTSHAYEMGGDYPSNPSNYRGSLGADLTLDETTGGYTIQHIVLGDPWDPKGSSPLARAGVNARVGDIILAVDGQKTSRTVSVDQLLVNKANAWVQLTLQRPGEDTPHNVSIQTLFMDTNARYREWVNTNRQKVLDATDNRIGYLHVPNMGPLGYSEFHRSYVSQIQYDGLIVDVRFNGGGHVSQLLIERLARKPVAYNNPRWFPTNSYPDDAISGPIVAITDAFAGSDGDIFSHVFKLRNLGPLVGTRTWGGVIGIWPRHPLADGSLTSQPEFAYWFKDVGWDVENYGTQPDIHVEYTPQDFANNHDPQLQRAIDEALQRLQDNPPTRPTFDNRPNLAPAPLPNIPKEEDVS